MIMLRQLHQSTPSVLNLLRRQQNGSVSLLTCTAGIASIAATVPKTANGGDHNGHYTNETPSDIFAVEFQSNRIELSPFQRIFLGVGSSIAALADPKRQDMIACLGETTGEAALVKCIEQMRSVDEGLEILEQKPRINSRTVDLEALRHLPENSFGRCYIRFLDENRVTPDSRLPVHFLDDPDLAYVMTRYRETHDLVHTILDMPTKMLGEVAVKWIEAVNTGLPMCLGGAVFGAIRLQPKHRQLYMTHYLPWALKTGRNMKPLLSVYWEQRWEQDVDDLRKELNITLLQIDQQKKAEHVV